MTYLISRDYNSYKIEDEISRIEKLLINYIERTTLKIFMVKAADLKRKLDIINTIKNYIKNTDSYKISINEDLFKNNIDYYIYLISKDILKIKVE